MSNSLTIWVFQTGEPLHIDVGNPRPMRAMNLANALVAAGHKVVLWSSAFYHQEKRHRSRSAERISISPYLEIRLIPSPGYRSNIGLGRLWDHAVLARNFSRLLKNETSVPDVAFIGYPPIETAAVMTRWLFERGVPCILDVKDQWPTIFLNALPRPARAIGRIALSPYFYFAQRAMRDATAMSAMANGFLQWALDFASRPANEFDRVVPLTIQTGQVTANELEAARKWWDEKGVLADNRPRVCFVGSHSAGFDFTSVIDAARSMKLQKNVCEFVICGDGANTDEWRHQAEGLENVYFANWVDRAQIEVLAERSLAALAPYKNSADFVMSVPNKVIDYLSLGLPVLSPLRGEVAALITAHGVGLSYGSDSGKTLAQCIESLKLNPGLRDKISVSAKFLYREKFSFERVYGGLVRHLEVLGERKRSEL